MKVGDLVKLKARYSDWYSGVGVFLGTDHPSGCGEKCRVLFDDTVLVFHRHELETINKRR
mgnify:CR=1 FL=1